MQSSVPSLPKVMANIAFVFFLKEAAASVAGGSLNKVSFYSTKLAGAPGPYEFAALAGLIGIVSEVQFKGIAKHAILHAIPGLGLIATIISTIAISPN
jgi:hypothetical protein